MAAPGVLQSEFVLNGSYGEIYDENAGYLAEAQAIEGMIRANRRDIFRAGSRMQGYKLMTVAGEGNLRLWKVTSMFLEIVSEPMRNNRQLQRQMNLRIVLDDPEGLGVEEVRLLQCKFWEVPIGFNVNDVGEETVPFTFEGIQLKQIIDRRTTNMLASLHASRYQPLGPDA